MTNFTGFLHKVLLHNNLRQKQVNNKDLSHKKGKHSEKIL